MRKLQRLLLGVLSSIVTVSIACAYGIPYAFAKRGRVVDVATKAGIAGIRVTCADPAGDRTLDVTDERGDFSVEFDRGQVDCVALAFDDVDGAEGGAYQQKTVTGVPGDQQDLVIELDPAVP